MAIEALLLLLAIGISFSPALWSGFIWDDYTYIIRSDLIHATDAFRRIWFSHQAVDFWPFSNSLFVLEWRLWGESPLGYHIVNLFIHVINACLILLIVRRVWPAYGLAISLLFAVHPLAVDSVAWIIQTKSTVATMFALVTCLAFIYFTSSRNVWWWLLSLLSFTASLLTKTSFVALPIVFLILSMTSGRRLNLRKSLELIPFFMVAAIIGFIAINWYPNLNEHFLGQRGIAESIADASYLIVFYLSKIIFPYPLSFTYGTWGDLPPVWIRFLSLALLICALVFLRRQIKTLLSFIVLMFPVLGFFEIYYMRYSYAADHWQYPAYVLIISVVAREVKSRTNYDVAKILSVLVCLIFMFMTFNRCLAYRSEETIWRDVLDKVPNSALAHNNLGNLLDAEGKSDEALQHYLAVLNRDSNDVEANVNIGAYYIGKSRPQESIPYFQRAIQFNPDSIEAYYNLAVAYARMNRFTEAIPAYRMAIKLKPNFNSAKFGLAISLAESGRTLEAKAEYESILRSDPNEGRAHFNLGTLLESMGEKDAAQLHLNEALRLLPNDPTVRAKVKRN